MTSYVKFVVGDLGNRGDEDWAFHGNDFDSYLITLSSSDQLRFVLDQTLSLSYFFWIYGGRAHELMTSYSGWLKEFTETRLAKLEFRDLYDVVFKTILNIQRNWYGYDWVDVPIKTIGQFLFSLADRDSYKRHPLSMTQSSVIPYLMERNLRVQEGFDLWTDKLTIPNYHFTTCGTVEVTNSLIGTQFYAKITDAFKGRPQEEKCVRSLCYPILQMFCKTNLQTKSFSTILRELSWRCLDHDFVTERSETARLFYATAAVLNNLFSADFLDIADLYGNCPLESTCNSYPVHTLFNLLSILNRTQGIKIDNREIFARFFGEIAKKSKSEDLAKIVEFVRTEGTNVASAECLAAFKASELGACEAIELISQTKPVIAQEDVDSGTDETGDESEDEDDETNLDLTDLPERDDADPSLEADDVPEEDQDTSTDADEGEDDSSSSSEGDDNQDDPGSEGEDDPDGATASGDVVATDDPDTQSSAQPEQIEISDDEGIAFEVLPEGSETVDSVMFREELDAWITDILANPPKKLSPQSIAALTKLQKFWLHLLSVEAITGILERLIALPDKFKKIKNSKE